MRKLLPVILVAFTAFAVACGGSKEAAQQSDVEQEISNMPEWYMNPPADNDEFLFAIASAKSSRKDMARQRAQINAKQQLASKLGEKVESLQKMFQEEVTSGDQTNYSDAFTNATKTITNQELKGATVEEMSFQATNQNTQFECYILMKLPVGEARAALDNALSKEEEMYVKFKESKAFDELQNNLDRIGNEE